MLLNLLEAENPWFLFRFDSPMNACRSVAIWLTVALAVAFALIMFLMSGGTRKKCAKISLIVTIVYVAAPEEAACGRRGDPAGRGYGRCFVGQGLPAGSGGRFSRGCRRSSC